jgi:hypothetical protein
MEFWKSGSLPRAAGKVDFTLTCKKTLTAHGFVEKNLGGDEVCSLFFSLLSFFLFLFFLFFKDCLFRVVIFALQLRESTDKLRRRTVRHMRTNPALYEAMLLGDEETEEGENVEQMRARRNRELNRYCDEMEIHETYGTNIEVQALRDLLSRPIFVIACFPGGMRLDIGDLGQVDHNCIFVCLTGMHFTFLNCTERDRVQAVRDLYQTALLQEAEWQQAAEVTDAEPSSALQNSSASASASSNKGMLLPNEGPATPISNNHHHSGHGVSAPVSTPAALSEGAPSPSAPSPHALQPRQRGGKRGKKKRGKGKHPRGVYSVLGAAPPMFAEVDGDDNPALEYVEDTQAETSNEDKEAGTGSKMEKEESEAEDGIPAINKKGVVPQAAGEKHTSDPPDNDGLGQPLTSGECVLDSDEKRERFLESVCKPYRRGQAVEPCYVTGLSTDAGVCAEQ